MSTAEQIAPVVDQPANDQIGVVQPPMTLVPGEDVGRRRMRALLGWFDDQEAIAAQLGRMPGLTEDLSAARARAADYRNRVALRPPHVSQDPEVSIGDAPLLARIENRLDVKSAFAGMRWRPAFVDLRRVLSFQKFINIPEDDVPTPPHADDLPGLYEFCLPTTQPLPPVGAFTDPDGKGFTISSLNPNLRIGGAQVSGVQLQRGDGLPPMMAQAVTIFVSMGASYLQVVRYRDRCFIRDGYHRATRLLRGGVHVVPCIFIEAASLADVSAPAGAFGHETIFGSHPPRLVDFWEDDVAAEVTQLSTRKVVRIRGDEFVVAR